MGGRGEGREGGRGEGGREGRDELCTGGGGHTGVLIPDSISIRNAEPHSNQGRLNPLVDWNSVCNQK